MIAAVIIAVLAIAALAYVVAPIGRMGKTLKDLPGTNEAEEKKRVALVGILDLEEERDGGKLSDAEFTSLRARYETEVVAALEELDEPSGPERLEDRLEQEIATARARMKCGTCGAPRGAEATRCPSCGSSY